MSIKSLMSPLFHNNKDYAFGELQSDIDRIFRQYRHFPRLNFDSPYGFESNETIPSVDVSETEKTVEIEIELPGVKEKDIHITVEDQSIVVEGQKISRSEKKDNNYRLIERTEGAYKRTIPLSFPVGDENIDADYSNGVLNITVNKPKDLAKKSRKIEIKKSGEKA